MRLPTTGTLTEETAPEAVAYCDALVEQSNEGRSDYDVFFDVNLLLFQYSTNYVPSPYSNDIVTYDIQNAVIAGTEIQLQQPPQVSLEPVETGERPTYYWAGPLEIGGQLGLATEQLLHHTDAETGQPSPPKPIDPITAGNLKSLAVPEEFMQALPPGMIRPDWIVELTDQLVAETYGKVFDVLRDRSNEELYLAQLLLDSNVGGWKAAAYDWDPVGMRHVLRIIPITQFHIDPNARDIADARWAGWDLPMDAAEACARWPHLVDRIIEMAKNGPLPSAGKAEISEAYSSKFASDMVIMRVMYLRDEPVPMRVDEATLIGDVLPQMAPAEDYDDMGNPVIVDVEVQDEETGETILVSAKTGFPVKPGDEDWPTRLGIRQLTFINGELVDDRECEHANIPILLCVNIPLAENKPYGQGEPMRMKGIQFAKSDVLDAMVENCRKNAYPIETISESMAKLLGDKARTAGMRAGERLTIPDAQWNAVGGKPFAFQTPAPMPESVPVVYGVLNSEMQTQSGHNEVMMGKPSNPNQSGAAIEALQGAATTMIGSKARRFGQVCKYLAQLELYQIVWALEVDDIASIVRAYPRHILDEIHTRARQRDIWRDVKVKAQAGNSAQTQKRLLAQSDYQMGAISLRTFCEETGRNFRLEQQRKALERQEEARLMGMLMPTAPPGEPGQETDQQTIQ